MSKFTVLITSSSIIKETLPFELTNCPSCKENHYRIYVCCFTNPLIFIISLSSRWIPFLLLSLTGAFYNLLAPFSVKLPIPHSFKRFASFLNYAFGGFLNSNSRFVFLQSFVWKSVICLVTKLWKKNSFSNRLGNMMDNRLSQK